MKKIFFITLLLCHQNICATPFCNIFTKDIYSLSELPLDVSNSQKIDSFTTKKRAQFEEKVLIPLNAAKGELTQLLVDRRDQRFRIAASVFPLTFATTLLTLDVSIGIALTKNTYQWLMSNKEFTDIIGGTAYDITWAPTVYAQNKIAPIEDIQRQLAEADAKMKSFEKYLFEGEAYQLECDYIIRKNNLPQSFQDKIEDLLLLQYSIDDEMIRRNKRIFIRSLVFHPQKLHLLSSVAEDYVAGLDKAIASLHELLIDDESILDEAEMLLTQLAEANEEGKRFFAYCQTNFLNEDTFPEIAIRIAKSLDLPFRVIDAAKTTIDDDFLWGNKQKKGVLLDVLHTRDDVGNCVLNPILIIKNIDHWVKADYMPWILKLFDNTPEKFYSPYFDLEMDWGKINIICSGKTSHDALEAAFNSRTFPFLFEVN